MTTLLFYRQARRDGGIRTGVEFRETPIAEVFEEGTGDFDPVLRWYLDLRCDGDGVPSDPEQAIDWLASLGSVVRTGAFAFAQELLAGLDHDIYTFSYNRFEGVPQGVSLSLNAKVNCRSAGQELASVLVLLARNWEETLLSLKSADVPD